jgi:hypothetical protein
MWGDSRESNFGRLGEILQFACYRQLGVELADLADRTDKRAPLLYGKEASVSSPDSFGIKSGRAFFEFKTKQRNEIWRGGSENDEPRYPPRIEQGINRRSRLSYLEAERRWRQPVVLSFLVIQSARIIAATLKQLGEPRPSLNPDYDLVNWDVRRFSLVMLFDAERLDRLFNYNDERTKEVRRLWLAAMPSIQSQDAMLRWLGTRQGEFQVVRQHIFDETEREWTHEAAE